ncbi:DUF5134 domain-containing protein [Pseudonocardia saturnea]
MGALAVLLAVVCLAVGVLHLARLALLRTDPVGELSHAAMGVGMAAMFSPLGDPVPAPVWVVVFGLCGAWFGSVALRTPSGPVHADAAHHVVGSGAMLFMLLGAHGAGVAGTGAAHAGHVGHGGGPDGGLGLASLVSIVLAGYFAWHVLRCVDHLRAVPAPAADAGAVRLRLVTLRPITLRDARVVAAAHVVMAAAMAVMLLGMV